MSLKTTQTDVPESLQFRSVGGSSQYINRGQLSIGGMARILRVFKCAGDSDLGKDFALKIARENDPKFVEPILTEAEVLDRIGGNGVPRLIDAVLADPDSSDFGSLPGFVMPLLVGADAATMCERSRPSLWLGLTILRLALPCYESIHKSGVVHLDSKPENLFVSPDFSSVTVLDFGISRMKETKISGILGTPAFISPEQLTGSVTYVHPTADIYSLATTAFTLITGNYPYGTLPPDASINDTYSLVLNGKTYPLSVFVSKPLPSGLDDIFSLALAKEPENRFQSASAFRAALDSVLGAGEFSVLGLEH